INPDKRARNRTTLILMRCDNLERVFIPQSRALHNSFIVSFRQKGATDTVARSAGKWDNTPRCNTLRRVPKPIKTVPPDLRRPVLWGLAIALACVSGGPTAA